MNTHYKPGVLAPLLPPKPRKRSTVILFGGLGAGLVVLCCLGVVVLFATQRNRIPALASLFATSTPTLSPTPTATNTPTVTPTPVNTPTPTITPTPRFATLQGSLAPWSDGDSIANRQIALCQVTGSASTGPADCTLMDQMANSDAQGGFQFSPISPGKYYLLYSSGLSDFNSGLGKWKSQTLKLSDVNWVVNQYCGSPDGNVSIYFLGGMLVNQEAMTILVRDLYTCDSPFVLALDPNDSKNAPLVATITQGQSITVEFKVGTFKK